MVSHFADCLLGDWLAVGKWIVIEVRILVTKWKSLLLDPVDVVFSGSDHLVDNNVERLILRLLDTLLNELGNSVVTGDELDLDSHWLHNCVGGS